MTARLYISTAPLFRPSFKREDKVVSEMWQGEITHRNQTRPVEIYMGWSMPMEVVFWLCKCWGHILRWQGQAMILLRKFRRQRKFVKKFFQSEQHLIPLWFPFSCWKMKHKIWKVTWRGTNHKVWWQHSYFANGHDALVGEGRALCAARWLGASNCWSSGGRVVKGPSPRAVNAAPGGWCTY